MRKRSDTPKSPPASSVGLRSSTRTSAAARRGEERSTPAGKEQSKTTSTVSKAADEKASVTTPGTAASKRLHAKKETPVAIEAAKPGATIPVANDPAVPETLQEERDVTSETIPVANDPAVPETLQEERDVTSATIPVAKDPAVPETLQEERDVTSTTICKEGFQNQFPEALMVDSVEANRGIGTLPLSETVVSTTEETLKVETELVTAGLASATEGNTQPIEARITPTGPIGVEELSGQDQENAAEAPAAVELAGKDQDRSAKASASGVEAGEVADHTQDKGEKAPMIGTEAGELPQQDQEEVANVPGLSTEAREMSGQEEERAAPMLASGREESSSVGGGTIMPPKEDCVSLSEVKAMDEGEHSEPLSAVQTRRSNRGNSQHIQVVSDPAAPESSVEPISAASTVRINGSCQQEAAAISSNTFSGKAFNFLLALEAAKTTDRGPNSAKDASAYFYVENSFSNNMVSSVEGETVLIVENLGLSSQTPAKLDDNMSGAVGEVNGFQNEADENVTTVFPVGKDLVGLTFQKKFGIKFFKGKVVAYESGPNWYKVKYEDGDEEELDLKEVHRLLYSDEAEDDERPAKRKHQQISTFPDSHKRSASKVKRSGSPGLASSEDKMKDATQVQERVNLRGYKQRLVIDTSNDRYVVQSGSGSQLSSTSDESSEDDDDDDDDPIFGKRKSRRKTKRNNQGKKRKRANNKSDQEKESTALQSRLSSKLKEESLSKSLETPTENRIATRRSIGVLSAHMTSSDDHSSASLKKPQGDAKGKLRAESPASEVSPLGGGAKLIGRKTKKDFGGQFYIGEIVHYDNRVRYYKVRYEDGDEEELEWGELAPTLLPQEGNHHLIALEAPHEATSNHSPAQSKEPSKKGSTTKNKEGAIIPYGGGGNNGDLASPKRKHRKKIRTASVSVMMKGTDNSHAASTSAAVAPESPPRPLAAVRFASASDADVFEYYAWGEAVSCDRSKCPELRATRLLPTSSPVVHLAVSRHHIVALTAAGQVWIWRCKHGGVHTRCNEWEHVALLDNRNVILVDISGPDVDRASAGYEPSQEDQVPDPFYLAAVCSNGEDIILQGSQPHESVHTYQYDNEPQYPGLRDTIMQSNLGWKEDIGRIVQVSVGMVEAADESPFVGYITDTDLVFIRSATRDYMEEVNLVTGYTGKPVKIQCGRVYHAIIMTDDGRAWTWGQGYYPGSNLLSAGFASKSTSPFSVCQPAVGTLVGRKVVDVGCYGEDFIALSNDGDVHQWTHALPNPASGVYNVPATPVYGQGPSIVNGDKLKQVAIGAGICAGISESGKVHTWRTSLKGGFVGTVGLERDALTPLAREEGSETALLSLGTRAATKVMCVAGSLLVVVKRKYRGRRGGRKKPDPSGKGKALEDEAVAED